MKAVDTVQDEPRVAEDERTGTDLASSPSRAETFTVVPSPGAVVGQLVGIADEGNVPLVMYPGQRGSAARHARTVVDLHGAMIGRSVVLMFDGGDPEAPIVIGVLRDSAGWPLAERPARIRVDADGERLTVDARTELVLRCGRASITLTKAGKVVIHGTYVSHHSTGVMRIKGGSIELN